MRWCRVSGRWVLAAGALATLSTLARADGALAPLALQPSERLQEYLSPAAAEQVPQFLFGDVVQGQADAQTVVQGHAELRRHDLVLHANQLTHDAPSNTVTATGQVRVNRQGDVYEGTELQLQLDTFEGHFVQPRFSWLKNGGHGQAERVDFLDEHRAVAHQTQYTTCERPPGGDWLPDWVVTADRIEFDTAQDTGTATGAVLRFKDVPVLAAPWLSFPLSDKRKSGVLPPTLNLDTQSGLEVTLPYYLNLAPNMDATLFPTVMSKRGIDLGAELRYLEPSFNGRVRGAFMPSDPAREHTDRWSQAWQHQQVFNGVPGLGTLGLRLNHNRVSDDDYWRDFPRSNTALTERLLPSEATLHWSQGDWQVSAGAQRWQTLQDVDAPITAPYDRVPSLAARYTPAAFALGGVDGWEATLQTEATHFSADRALRAANDVDGTRTLAVAEISKHWHTPGAYLKPALQLHARHYAFSQTLANGTRHQSYAIPTLSLDGGLMLERDTRLAGQDFVQTLEPRVLYARTGYRDQSFVPTYDTAAYDFNLATVFTPNPYGGHDRIADTHAVTLGATTRLLHPVTGAEVLSLGVAQRVRLDDQRVVLPGEAVVSERLSDLLWGGRVQWTPQWAFNGTVQYNPKQNESVRTTLGMRYQPGPYRLFNAAYRLNRSTPEAESQQWDFSWQWPVGGGAANAATPAVRGQGLGPRQWYSVGRLNYSATDNQIVDLVAGFEYDADCWIGRVVLDRLQRSTGSANQRILFQLEFVGFSRLGSNPLQTLKDNVPRYQYLREDTNPPSRFERYE